jgi:hypothetical protein
MERYLSIPLCSVAPVGPTASEARDPRLGRVTVLSSRQPELGQCRSTWPEPNKPNSEGRRISAAKFHRLGGNPEETQTAAPIALGQCHHASVSAKTVQQ